MQVEKTEKRIEIAVGKDQRRAREREREGRASESGSSPLAGFSHWL